jgi:NAD(P)-dependent dehydrogenase (short-subunit alcohol dehydrogenase family)
VKAAIVTGAAQGIGLAVARRLASLGQPVVIVGRTAEKVEAAEERLTQEGFEASGIVLDLTDLDQLPQILQVARARYGGVQALVNNAGISALQHAEELSREHWEQTLTNNLTSAAILSSQVATEMDESGRIVNVSSINGVISEPTSAAYSASKAGLISLTKSLAVDLAGRGVMVNCVAPGWVRTPMIEDFAPSLTRDILLRINLLGRLGEPEEIAEVVAFLCRPDVTYLTGQTIFVDGGQTAMAFLP